MVASQPDTIAAIATPPGTGGVGIIRVSGDKVPAIAQALLGSLPEPRRAQLHTFRDDQGLAIDSGLVLYFAAPASFTGEPVLELHGHGGIVVLDMLLQRVMSLGARRARPGEFSERAYLNDKLDLAQAEAIADLIESATAQAARAAMRSLEGVFSAQVHALTEALTRVRMYVEAAIDFPEEEIDFLSDDVLLKQLKGLENDFDHLLSAARQGRLLRDGLTLVIAGRPNAGKSSLLNALSGRDSAIVTAIPGTTRDLLREQIQLDGLPLHLVDTAGLRETTDPVELAGIDRAHQAIRSADMILLLVDDTRGWTVEDTAILDRLPPGLPVLRVYNKIDLTGRPAGSCQESNASALALSLRSGAGLDELRDQLKRIAGFEQGGGDCFSARQRHLDALGRARTHLDLGLQQLREFRAGELLAEELRVAQDALGEITGAFSSDALLGRIFSSFCIGK